MKRMLIMLLAALLLAGCARGVGNDLPLEQTVKIDPVTQDAMPPALRVELSDGEARGHQLTCQWNYRVEGDTWSGICADSAHPLEAMRDTQPVITAGDTARLVFASEPASVRVCCWPASMLGHMNAQGETPAVAGNAVTLLPGAWIYEVYSTWSDTDFHGSGYYCFYVDYASNGAAAQIAQEEIMGDMAIVSRKDQVEILEGEDALALTELLNALAYDPERICRCMHEYKVITESGRSYELNLTEGFARCDDGQAPLTEEQIAWVRQLLEKNAFVPVYG